MEQQYLNLIKQLLETGSRQSNRTGIDTFAAFGAQMRFDLRDDTFPLFTTRRIFWRGVIKEMLWFIRGSTDATELSNDGVHIWDANGSRAFLDSCGFIDREEGDLGPVYGFQWRHFGAEYKDAKTDYANQGIDQLKEVIEKLKHTPNDRRIMMTAWNPVDIPKMVLPPCHAFVQFYVDRGELSSHVYQRSADMGLGVPFNVASYALLTRMLAHVTNLKTKELVHTLGNYHIYVNHIDALREQLGRKPRAPPKLKIVRSISNIDNFTSGDFEIKDYHPYEKLNMRMAV